MLPPLVGQWCAITRQWCRFVNMDDHRLNKVIFKWAFRFADNRHKNWIWSTVKFYKSVKLHSFIGLDVSLNSRDCINTVSDIVTDLVLNKWKELISDQFGKSGKGGNKLRTYRKFKHDFGTEIYVECVMERKYRRAFALFRSSCAPIRIETGRYEGLSVNERVCFMCENSIEDEKHVLTECSLYDDLRENLYAVLNHHCADFKDMSNMEKSCHILAGSNLQTVTACAKYCHLLLYRRKIFNTQSLISQYWLVFILCNSEF